MLEDIIVNILDEYNDEHETELEFNDLEVDEIKEEIKDLVIGYIQHNKE